MRKQEELRLLSTFLKEGDEYRNSYAEATTQSDIALQIYIVRKQREMTVRELALKAGVSQGTIRRAEDTGSQSFPSIRALMKIAAALDLYLQVSMETFGSLAGKTAGLREENFKRPAFNNDPAFARLRRKKRSRKNNANFNQE